MSLDKLITSGAARYKNVTLVRVCALGQAPTTASERQHGKPADLPFIARPTRRVSQIAVYPEFFLLAGCGGAPSFAEDSNKNGARSNGPRTTTQPLKEELSNGYGSI